MKSLRSRLAGRALPAPLAASLVVGLGLGVMVLAEAGTSTLAPAHDFHYDPAAPDLHRRWRDGDRGRRSSATSPAPCARNATPRR
ncbi:MAG: hypothetical protein MZW92_13245 [Comamonadaceae bacterium]|nr:hypothetical protein [Comamonadaceae bacterium]